jgi:D-arabinose 1-dehydrogenase-like Zn-dependent alcohol dehydrogenase
MSETYRAIEVSKPGQLSEARKPLRDPGPNHVRIRVEACGVCHSDSATGEGKSIDWPRVPGHEVVGASMRSVQAFRAGRSVRAWVSGFSAAPAVIASFAAMVIS